MIIDAWLPVGFRLPGGEFARAVISAGSDWQIVEIKGGGRALIARRELALRWHESSLLEESRLKKFQFGNEALVSLVAPSGTALEPLGNSRAPRSKTEALAFAAALKSTRALDRQCPLQDAIYAESLSRLLPTYSTDTKMDDSLLLGSWLTGGVANDTSSLRRVPQLVGWMSRGDVEEVLSAAGFYDGIQPDKEAIQDGSAEAGTLGEPSENGQERRSFLLPGRPALARFLQEHVIDVVENRERYRVLGAGFPGAIVLCGPPGCGKTFAVERLIEYLKWPSFHIEASSVGSPYIHETSRKIAKTFDAAAEKAPSVIVIDEMDAFLAQRDAGDGQYRVEEVAEFLRRIPEATKNDVLVIAMTNRIAAIDPAILRRGRFDHIIEVGPAGQSDILALLESLLSNIPKVGRIDLEALATSLIDRPLSDAAFVVREGARLAARARQDGISQENLIAALAGVPPNAEHAD